MVAISVLFSSLVLAALPDPGQVAAAPVDSQRARSCEEILNKPTSDSTQVQLVISSFAFGKQPSLPPDVAPLLAEGIRQFFVVPRPLRLTTYEATDSGPPGRVQSAHLTIEGIYLLTLSRDGHITQAEIIGGSNDAPFDKAVLAALISLDTSALIPSFPPKFAADSVFVPIAIWPAQQDSSYRREKSTRSLAPATDFFSFKVATRKVDSLPTTKGNKALPRFPLSSAGPLGNGKVKVRFAVDSSGAIDARTVLVISSSDDAFTRAVAGVLPRMQLHPLVIEGCKVKALVDQPFDFRIHP